MCGPDPCGMCWDCNVGGCEACFYGVCDTHPGGMLESALSDEEKEDKELAASLEDTVLLFGS